MALGGVINVASRRSKSMKEAWPSDRQKKSWTIKLSSKVVRHKISSDIFGTI
jgi:hypothetical protein